MKIEKSALALAEPTDIDDALCLDTGTFIRLKSNVLGIYSDGGHRSAVMVPEGAII